MKKNKALFVMGLIIVILLFLLIGYYMIRIRTKDNIKPNDIEQLSSIEGYGYNLEDRDTKIYKENFEKLKDLLESDDINYEEYASLLAKLYIIDLYTIDNKINKYDIGGLEFIYPSIQENFTLKVEDTLYKYVEDNSYGKRDQELPEVVEINVDNIESQKIKVLDDEFDGYILDLSWKYKKDLEYDDHCTIEIIKSDEKLYVVKQSVS